MTKPKVFCTSVSYITKIGCFGRTVNWQYIMNLYGKGFSPFLFSYSSKKAAKTRATIKKTNSTMHFLIIVLIRFPKFLVLPR
ncbi:hypothetical protein DX873_11640 [Flagellimonas nanhaiensis]|uniref:Uncharacterized protein n=1 Tax=Flagellimonas nanhaiensis TaxID=2292706 RepID=A0A371JR50_9FLAO|nr:hypothetical protein DX873_11640 [Allomuricauda nanhaiensis]